MRGFAKKNRTFLLTAIVLWCCLMTLICAAGGLILNQNLREERQTIATETEAAMANVREYVDSLVSREYKIAYQLQDTYWIVKMSSNTDVFADWLTPTRLKEITKDFLFYNNMDSEVNSRAVYFPGKGYVLHSNGYNKDTFYFQQEGIPSDSVREFIDLLRSTAKSTQITFTGENGEDCLPGQIVLLNPIQKSRSPNAYLYTSLKTNAIEKHILQILPAYITGVDILSDGLDSPVLSVRDSSWREDQPPQEGGSVQLMGWEMVFYIDESAYPLTAADPLKLLFSGMVIILGSGLLALGLAWITYRPLGRVLKIIPEQNRTGDAWEDLSNSLTWFRGALEQANREMTLRRLLLGDPNTDLSGLPYLQMELYVQTFLIPCGEVDDVRVTALMEDTFRDAGSWNVEVLPYYDNSMVLCFFSDRKQNLEELEGRVSASGSKVLAGSVEQGPQGVAASFKVARKKAAYAQMTSIPRFYLPIDLESRLYQLLHSGESGKALTLYDHLREKNERLLAGGEMLENDVFQLGTILMSDMVRVLSERTSTRELLASLENMDYASLDSIFSTLKGTAVELGAQLSTGGNLNHSVATEIVRYIDDHFSECDLSVNTLQDVFNMSANTINKNIRAVTGETFMPYLTRLRMEKARELLSVNGSRVSEVYRLVGYEQEYSFRRAFARYNGYKAQNHLLKNTQDPQL